MPDSFEKEAAVLLSEAGRRQTLEAEADRPLTKTLFGLWLLVVLVLAVLGLAKGDWRDTAPSPVGQVSSLPWIVPLLIMVLSTGPTRFKK
jgi:hypothetical protein